MKTHTKKAIILVVTFLWLFFGTTFWKECVENICRTDKESMLIAAEMKFIQDQNKWIHKFKFSDDNKCKYHISSIAYWYGMIESWLWSSKLSKQTNNIFSIKRWSWKYQYIWKKHFWMLQKSKYLKYPNKILSVLDFMYTYKYWYSCGMWPLTVNVYKTWKTSWDKNSKRYYDNLISSINYFEKKYYWPDNKYKKVVQVLEKKPKVTKKPAKKTQLEVKKVWKNKYTLQAKKSIKKVWKNKYTVETVSAKK